MSRKRSNNNNKNILLSNENETPEQIECRVCLQYADKASGGRQMLGFWPLKERWKNNESTIAEDFTLVTNIQISSTDHTKFICHRCLKKLKDCVLFVQTARHSDEILQNRTQATNMISPKSMWPKPIQIDKVLGDIEVEVKQEVLSDDENVMEMEHELKMDIKVEPEEYQYKEIPVHGIFSYDDFSKANGNLHTEDNLDVTVKEEMLSDEEDFEMTPDMPLDCMLCTKTFNSVSGLKAHVIAQHSYITIARRNEGVKQPFQCTTCRRSFLTNTDLIVHETCHNKHACYMCNSKFDSFAQLSKHRKKCPKNVNCLTKIKTLEDVRRPSLEPQQIIAAKEVKESKNVTDNKEIDNSNIEHGCPIEISDVTDPKTMDNNEQETVTNIEQKQATNYQNSDKQSHSLNLEQITHAAETNSTKSESNTGIESILESNNSSDSSNLELNNSQTNSDKNNCKPNNIETNSNISNSELITSTDDKEIGNLKSPTLSTELNSVTDDSSCDIRGSKEEVDFVTATIVYGIDETAIKTKSKRNSPRSESMESNSESNNIYKINLNSSKFSSAEENNSHVIELNSSQPKSDSVDSSHLEQNNHISDSEKIDLLSNSHSLDSNKFSLSVESSNLAESANNNKLQEKSDNNEIPDVKNSKSNENMKIHLEIHSIDKKSSIDDESEVECVESMELNEDNVL